MSNLPQAPVVETRNLKKYYKVHGGFLHAVDGIDLSIFKGDTLGVVGESGCGKSTLGRTLIGLEKPTEGQIFFQGAEITLPKQRQHQQLQTKMSMIFQDPYSSLNPRMSISDLIADPMKVNRMFKSNLEYNKRVAELMDTVGLSRNLGGSFPHELDGGRRQRIGVARALAVNPEFIVCDEPVSALDVSIQAQILNLLMDLRDQMGLTYMFITHDLSVVKHISDYIMVTYLGKCVEYGTVDQIFANPLHPYTKALFSAIPVPSLEARFSKPQILEGEVSNPINPKMGCRLYSRCPYASEKCIQADVDLIEVNKGHQVACILVREGVPV